MPPYSNISGGTSTDIAQLTQLINSINQTAQRSANAGRIPDGAGLEGISSSNIRSALSGELDPSVITQIAQQAAERGVATGSPMGAGSNAAFLRSLGLNSLDLMNTGQDWLTQALNRNPTAPLIDPTGLAEMRLAEDIADRQRAIAQWLRPQSVSAGLASGGFGGGSVASSLNSAPAIGGLGSSMNWADLFNAGPTGSYFSEPVNNFPFGVGQRNAMGAGTITGSSDNFFDPMSNTLGANPFQFSYAPTGQQNFVAANDEPYYDFEFAEDAVPNFDGMTF